MSRKEAGVPGAIVFGGAGFIGTHLLRDLAARGVAPLISADLTPPREPVAGVRYVECDVREPIGIDAAGADTIYNLAGLVTTPGHPDADFYRTNVTGAVTVCDFAENNDIRAIVFTSTMSVYPTGDGRKTESSPTRPVNAYGASKLLGESIHRRWRDAHPDNRLIIVRPAVIFGPGDMGNFSRLRTMIDRGLFIFPGRRDTVKACGYVGDLVDSFGFVLGIPGPLHIYNFAYPDRTTIAEICALISNVIGKPAPRRSLSLPLLRAASRPFELLETVGVRTGINRARINKLVEATDIYPEFLLEHRFTYATTPAEGVRRWLAGGSAGTSAGASRGGSAVPA